MAFRRLDHFLIRFQNKPSFKKGLERAEIFELVRVKIKNLLNLDQNLLRQIQLELQEDTLIIKCPNAYVAQELRFCQEKIREAAKLKNLRIKTGY